LVKEDREVDRAKYPLHYLGNLIQTTEAVAPACSGGALLNADGEAVGLTCVVSGVHGKGRGGFAIPLDTNAKRIIEALKKGEEVEYGFLGVVLERWEDRVARNGVNLFRISPGSPADLAGLMPGDRVVRIDGKAVRHNNDLFLSIGMALAGNTVKVVVARGRREETFNVTLAKFYVPGKVIAAKQAPARFGLRVDWTSVLLVRNPFPFTMRAPASGVVIREVVEGSSADKARLQPDKIITKVDGKAVSAPADYYREVAKAGKKVELTYLTSNGRSDTLTLEEK
jgi:serine protease Do